MKGIHIKHNVEACIGVLRIQDICHSTSRDIGHFPFYFQGYGILRSISGILQFVLQNIQIQSRNTNSINKNDEGGVGDCILYIGLY